MKAVLGSGRAEEQKCSDTSVYWKILFGGVWTGVDLKGIVFCLALVAT